MRFCAIIVALCAAHSAAYAQEDPRKEYLRLQATEFCATVKQPPPAMAAALNQLVQADPKTWMPVIDWWNAIAERYAELKCGDA